MPRGIGYVVFTHSLNRDVRSLGLTTVADVTQDHANSRAMTHHWLIGLPPRGIPFRHSKYNDKCFFYTPARGGRVTSLTN